jgi:hypothetical protein
VQLLGPRVRFDTSGHQQSHVEWLKAAFQRNDDHKLSVVIIQPTHNNLFCILMRLLGRVTPEFEEMFRNAGIV